MSITILAKDNDDVCLSKGPFGAFRFAWFREMNGWMSVWKKDSGKSFYFGEHRGRKKTFFFPFVLGTRQLVYVTRSRRFANDPFIQNLFRSLLRYYTLSQCLRELFWGYKKYCGKAYVTDIYDKLRRTSIWTKLKIQKGAQTYFQERQLWRLAQKSTPSKMASCSLSARVPNQVCRRLHKIEFCPQTLLWVQIQT